MYEDKDYQHLSYRLALSKSSLFPFLTSTIFSPFGTFTNVGVPQYGQAAVSAGMSGHGVWRGQKITVYYITGILKKTQNGV